MTSFASLVQRIDAAYEELGHELGWRFLATPKSTLAPTTRMAFVGLNPGGAVYQPPVASVEEGNAYRLERWGSNGTPTRIQVQVWRLYEAIANKLEVSVASVMDETLAAHFCPFRSAAWDSLPNRAESIAFSRELWRSILAIARPSVLISLSHATRHLEGVLRGRGSRRVAEPERLATGWGDVSVRLSHYQSPNGNTLVIGLPHLSRYAIFGRAGSEPMLEQVAAAVCAAIQHRTLPATHPTLQLERTTRDRPRSASASHHTPSRDSSVRSGQSPEPESSALPARAGTVGASITRDDHAALAARASRYLSTDHVRRAQAAVYRDLLTSGPSGDPLRDFAPGLDRRAVAAFAVGDLRYDKLPDDVRDRLRHLERQMPVASHRWPKGILATALALTE